MKTFLIVVLIIVVAAVFLNDVGHYALARYKLSQGTQDIVTALSAYARKETRDDAARKAAELAQEKGIVVYQYDQDGQGIRVWTRVPVTGTWIIEPFMAWRSKIPSGTPVMLEDYGTSVFQ